MARAGHIARWIKPVHADDPSRLAVEVRTGGLVIVHQRSLLRRDEFREIIVTLAELRAMVAIVEAETAE